MERSFLFVGEFPFRVDDLWEVSRMTRTLFWVETTLTPGGPGSLVERRGPGTGRQSVRSWERGSSSGRRVVFET